MKSFLKYDCRVYVNHYIRKKYYRDYQRFFFALYNFVIVGFLISKFLNIKHIIFRHYHCSLSGIKQKNCHARLYIDRKGKMTESGRHSHNENFSQERMLLFRRELEATSATEIGKISEIYAKVAQK